MMNKLLKFLPVTVIISFIFLLESPAQETQSERPVNDFTIPIIIDGQAQIVPRFKDPDLWIRHDLWVEAEFDSDGDGKPDRMHVAVTRPRQTDTEGLRLPAIYGTSPYNAGTGPVDKEFFWDVRHELQTPPPARKHFPAITPRGERPIISKREISDWVPRGFIVVHSSSPGTGLSQGCPTIGGDNESLAPKAVIDWLNGRATGYTTPEGNETVTAYWSTGKVGMTGTSFDGTLPLAAATTGVEGLEAIIPIAPNTSYYHYYRTNGLIRHPGGWIGEDIDFLYDWVHSGNPERAEWCDCNVRDKELLEGFDRVTGDYNDFWAGRDYLNDLGPLKAAVLMSHGFNDWNVVPEHSNRISQALKAKGVPVQIYYHQGGHGDGPPFEMMNRWFTHYLFGIENGVENDPKAWIVRENDNKDHPTPYEDYPNPLASDVTLYLRAGAPEAGELSTYPASNPGTETLIDNFSFSGSSLAQAEWTNHRLIYLTPTLSDSVHISGTAGITIKLASSKPAANLSVWLVSLPWNNKKEAKITDNIITRGWADPQNHRSLTKSKPLVPGQYYEMTFNLQPDDQIIPAGQQIGLMIFSSDRDFTLWPDPGTELTVDLDATSISLPVVGGKSAFGKATEKNPYPSPSNEAVIPRQQTASWAEGWWMNRHQDILEREDKGESSLIFIGNSIIHHWEDTGIDSWNSFFGEMNPINMGFGGDQTQHVLWRLDHGELEGINPRVAVIMIGTNNASSGHTPDMIAGGVKKIIATVRKQLPDTKILLLSIFPRDEPHSLTRKVNAETTRLYSGMADQESIFFLDLNHIYLDSEGNIPEGLMPDKLHPNAEGYQLWGEAMKETLDRLYKN